MPAENKVKPCPFCGCSMVELVRPGTSRQSCIVACADCGCRLESNEIGALEAWNRRADTMEQKFTAHNKQSTPCKHCSGAASMFGVGCYCPWCGRKIE